MAIMTEKCDLGSFLPSFWTENLVRAPLLGSTYKIIELDENFIEFIESDGLALDEDNPYTSALSSSDEFSDSDYSDQPVSYSKPSEKFPKLNELIKCSIESLGGAVVPKLNWTVPKVNVLS